MLTIIFLLDYVHVHCRHMCSPCLACNLSVLEWCALRSLLIENPRSWGTRVSIIAVMMSRAATPHPYAPLTVTDHPLVSQRLRMSVKLPLGYYQSQMRQPGPGGLTTMGVNRLDSPHVVWSASHLPCEGMVGTL